MRQLVAADLIVLSKLDLIDGPARVCVRKSLRETAPQARFIEACHGRIPWELLLGVGAIPSQAKVPLYSQHNHTASNKEHSSFSRASFESEQPFDRARLRAAVEALPESVLRVKGVLYVVGEGTHSVVLQKVGRRWTLERGSPWERGSRRSRLIVIGTCGHADISHLVDNFTWALAHEPVATP